MSDLGSFKRAWFPKLLLIRYCSSFTKFSQMWRHQIGNTLTRQNFRVQCFCYTSLQQATYLKPVTCEISEREDTAIFVICILLTCKIFCIITVRVYEARAKTCTFPECLLVPYLCVFYCDVVELGSYGNLKYYDTMTEEGKKYFRIVCYQLFLKPFKCFLCVYLFLHFLVLFLVSSFLNNSFLHVFIDGIISYGSFFKFFFSAFQFCCFR